MPKSAGIYQFFDKNKKLLYIGKAKNLNARVKSYFRFSPSLRPSPELSSRISIMISQAKHLEYIKTATEHDALILENSLIKQLKPKYNILLRDDKTYPYLAVNFDEKFPRVEITRKIVKGKNIKYFGPFSVGARNLLESLYMLFPLVQKKTCIKGGKACLFYQIHRCLAPCEGKISEKEYESILLDAIKLIHHPKPLIQKLQAKMQGYSKSLNFEEAAKIRDAIKSIEQSQTHSQIDLAKLESFDLLHIMHQEESVCALRFFIRDGKVVSSSHTISHTKAEFDANSLYKQMLLSFYAPNIPMPVNTIFLAHDIDEKNELESLLSERFGKKIHLKHPKRGEKLALIKLSEQNAKELIKRHKKGKTSKLLGELMEYFELSSYPRLIEVYDNSHLGGVAKVGGLVVWEDEGFNKEKYRHLHLHHKDEYSQMKENLTRRVARFDKDYPPDLWLIDGGKTLLDLALDIVQSSGIEVDVLAISKEKQDAKTKRAKGKAKDIIHSKNGSFELNETDEKLQFLQRLRDEAHRFAISFHRKTKLKQDKQSSLLLKSGLSEAKIKKLLSFYGSFENIQKADKKELEKILKNKIK